MAVFGLDCYLNNPSGPRLTGKIKVHSSDFHVQEISCDGNIAGESPPVYKTEEQEPVQKKAKLIDSTIERKRETINDKHDGMAICSPIDWRAIRPDPLQYLENIIGNKRLTTVKEFSLSSQEPAAQESLNLGVFNDKQERTIIHECLQYQFPWLNSITKQFESDDKQCVLESYTLYGKFAEILSADVCCDLLRFIRCRNLWEQSGASTDDFQKLPNIFYINADHYDKEQRKSLHTLLSKHFGMLVKTSTIKLAGHSYITVSFTEKKSSKRPHASEGPVLRFVLYKNNVETLYVLKSLSLASTIPVPRFKIAGMKDKIAETWQFVTTDLCHKQKLLSVSAEEGQRPYKIMHVHEYKEHLQLGHLGGNQFGIIIRDIQLIKDDVESQTDLGDLIPSLLTHIEGVRNNGFINYFGKQRFGDECSIPSSAVGLQMLLGNYRAAVNLILAVDPGRPPSDADQVAKKLFHDTHDAVQTLKLMPIYKTREVIVLKALKRYGYDDEGCRKALVNLPHNYRSMYVHSYCSLIWNHAVSERIRTFGKKIVPGDLVLGEESGSQAVVVSNEDIERGRFTINDVILPLLGHKTILSGSVIGEFYTKRLMQDGIEELTCFRMRKLDMNIPGTYRKILCKPENLTFDWVHGDNNSNSGFQAGGGTSSSEKLASCDVRLTFQLPPCCYATMCLREIIR